MSTSQTHAYYICNPATESGALDTLPPTEGLRVLTREQLQSQTNLRFGEHDKLCLATESVLDDVLARLDDPNREHAVLTFKDKFAFRKLLQPLYPDFYFNQFGVTGLNQVKLEA